ncbi:hypothetical protein BDW22DRAFT_1433411 [Trametopsis cervina]|nr:hypothetical protein BDW22DRAFT_1433411 [Trametopsis cervina]
MILMPTLSAPEPPQTSTSIHLSDSKVSSDPAPGLSPVRVPQPAENKPSKYISASVPNVILDEESISCAMAARLASSLLCHVLFLKSQIPFPVVQLSRMPSNQSKSKAYKKREELVAAIDTLTSHLETTFVALSSAFAQYKDPADAAMPVRTCESAHMMFIVGPSVGAAKARIALVVDGLEVKPLGGREDSKDKECLEEKLQNESFSEDADSESEDEQDFNEDSETSESEESETGDEDEEVESQCEDEPPASRSPSPVSSDEPSPANSRPTTPPLDTQQTQDPTPVLSVVGTQRANPTHMPPPNKSRAQEQDILRAADRLLSRTLANACAEEHGGMASELAPTQTHVLLRAPRRFTHPAWVPRQNLTRSLETSLQTFMTEATATAAIPPRNKKFSVLGTKTEGVWISCRTEPPRDRGSVAQVAEEDELIWWQWNGKLIGFSDW